MYCKYYTLSDLHSSVLSVYRLLSNTTGINNNAITISTAAVFILNVLPTLYWFLYSGHVAVHGAEM